MKKILITGSNGLLGHKLVSALITRDDVKLIITSAGENQNPPNERYTFERMDITDSARVEEILSKYQPDCVINSAAMTNVDQCENERDKCWKINVNGVKNLAESCKNIDTHLVHLSTDFIFDGTAGPYQETDKPNPLSHYGHSKWESEKALQIEGLRWSVIRTILVYGIVKTMSRSNFVLWAKGALEKGDPIKVVTDQVRMPTLAEDLAEGCILAALKEKTGIYHICGKDGGNVYELVKIVADVFDLDMSPVTAATSEEIGAPANRPPVTGFILDKAQNELGYKPHPFRDGLQIMKSQMHELGL